MQRNKKGFTLIELLIVIGILSVLATVAVLVINPTELFKQARDSQRQSDLGAIKGALVLYLNTKSNPDLSLPGDFCKGETDPRFWATADAALNHFSVPEEQHANTGRAVDGTGWVPINLEETTGGSALTTLPIDPFNPNTPTQSYSYACKQTAAAFEINANMESERYSQGGPDDVESIDGGPVETNDTYEIGTEPGLDL